MDRKSRGPEVTWTGSHVDRKSRGPEVTWTGSHVDRKSRGQEVTWTGSHVDRKSRGPEVTWTGSHVDRKSRGPEVTWTGRHVDRKARGPEGKWTGRHVDRKARGRTLMRSRPTSLSKQYRQRRYGDARGSATYQKSIKVRLMQDIVLRLSNQGVRVAGGESGSFNVDVGLRQRSALSPYLFLTLMDVGY